MSPLAILLLSLGLAADATAVAATQGLSRRSMPLGEAARVGLVFGLFQAGMPLLGWALGAGVGDAIAAIDHWIAFGILFVLGARMVWGAWRGGDDSAGGYLSWRALLALAIATSIDALAAGITLPLMDAPMAATILCIGVVTGVLSLLAMLLAPKLGQRFAGRVTMIGGLVLIGMGTKILVEHLSA